MLAMVFETVKVLVALATNLTTIRLLFLHAHGARVWDRRGRINDAKASIRIFLELLILVAMLHLSVQVNHNHVKIHLTCL